MHPFIVTLCRSILLGSIFSVTINLSGTGTEEFSLILQIEGGVDNRLRVLIVGGLYGSQPVGRELVIRLARHLGAGWAKKNQEVEKLLEETQIFLVPAVDIEGFENAEAGKLLI